MQERQQAEIINTYMEENIMGNRAIIQPINSTMGVYLHWNGGVDSVTAFLKYLSLIISANFSAPLEGEKCLLKHHKFLSLNIN